MSKAQLQVVEAGPLVTFQDAGRPGHMRFGVSASGPMDSVSHAAANLALGNPQSATAIEISLGGLTLKCVFGAVTMAVLGGDFQLEIGDRKTDSGTIFTLNAGETLTIKQGGKGNWCYLAIAGEIIAKRWLNQTATHGLSGFGGGALVAGQHIDIENSRRFTPQNDKIESFSFGHPDRHFRVVLGPQQRHFKNEAFGVLLGSEYSLSGAYDRMGVQLNGPKLALKNSLSIPSEPILKGSIQVFGEGNSAVLLADHQTTGGYPKIATMISADIDAFVQTPLHSRFRFIAIDPQSAIVLARVRSIELKTYFSSLFGPKANNL